MIRAIDCHQQEWSALASYLEEASEKDHLVKIVLQTKKKKQNGIMFYFDNKNANKINEDHLQNLRTMKLHGEYFTQQQNIPNVNIKLSNKWLETSYLRPETESLICAAQEQTLATNYVNTKIWKVGNNPTCRLYRKENETIQHIVSGCGHTVYKKT